MKIWIAAALVWLAVGALTAHALELKFSLEPFCEGGRFAGAICVFALTEC